MYVLYYANANTVFAFATEKCESRSNNFTTVNSFWESRFNWTNKLEYFSQTWPFDKNTLVTQHHKNYMGKLHVGRNILNDSWPFLNGELLKLKASIKNVIAVFSMKENGLSSLSFEAVCRAYIGALS